MAETGGCSLPGLLFNLFSILRCKACHKKQENLTQNQRH
jgi:hypothetical protein